MDSMIIKSGNEIFLPNYYRTLSSIYEQKLDFKNALSSFRQFEFIKDSTHHRSSVNGKMFCDKLYKLI